MTASLVLSDVTKEFDIRDSAERLLVLDHVNLHVRAGELLTLVGPSGSGKTTLLDLLSGLTTPTSGEILQDGLRITGPSPDRGVVFQQYALFPWRKIGRAHV